MSRRKIIAVIGDSECSEDIKRLAYEVGRLIAHSGAILVCGGYGGVMEESARGAKDAGGITVCILSGKSAGDANSAIDIPIVTGMGEARNAIITRTADGVIAVGGGPGTLSEIGFSLKLGLPLVGLRSWILSHHTSQKAVSFPSVKTPQEAFDLLLKRLSK